MGGGGRKTQSKNKEAKKKRAAFSCIAAAPLGSSSSTPEVPLWKPRHFLQILISHECRASRLRRGGLQVVCYTGVGLHRKWHMQPDWDGPGRGRHKHRAQMGPGASGSSTLMNTQLSTTLHNMQNNILRPRRKREEKKTEQKKSSEYHYAMNYSSRF